MVGQMSSGGDALPSVALTKRFLTLCAHHGAEHLAVKMIAVGRNDGVPGLPARGARQESEGIRSGV